MKSLFTMIFFLLIISSNAQSLKGKWHWEDNNLSGEVFFGEESYLIKLYLKGSSTKVAESFSYYKISNDTLIFSKYALEEKTDNLSYYKILESNDGKLSLLDLSNNQIDEYFKLDEKVYNHSKVNTDEFYFEGESIVCVSGDVRADYNNCLNFNTIGILSSKQKLESFLGSAYTSAQQDGKVYLIYLLPGKTNSPPYLAVNYDDKNQLTSIQLTGSETSDKFAFSGIRLGDYFTMVENRLGKPTNIQKLDSQIELWSYDPFTITIEIKDKKVFSIKLRRI